MNSKGRHLQEKIGKIILDDKHYPGEDFYCDGVVEDELLDIVRKYRMESGIGEASSED